MNSPVISKTKENTPVAIRIIIIIAPITDLISLTYDTSFFPVTYS